MPNLQRWEYECEETFQYSINVSLLVDSENAPFLLGSGFFITNNGKTLILPASKIEEQSK